MCIIIQIFHRISPFLSIFRLNLLYHISPMRTSVLFFFCNSSHYLQRIGEFLPNYAKKNAITFIPAPHTVTCDIFHLLAVYVTLSKIIEPGIICPHNQNGITRRSCHFICLPYPVFLHSYSLIFLYPFLYRSFFSTIYLPV